MMKIYQKLKALERLQNFSHYMSRWIFSGNLSVPDRILSNFEPIQEEDPIKNENARVVTTLFIDFSDAQWQLTPKSVMEFCRYSYPPKLL